MNVARSTFVRRGYLLTALAVAVLLGASSGTAWAQTPTRFTLTMGASSGTLEEGANDSNATPDRVTLTISRSDPTYLTDHDNNAATPDVRRPVFNNVNKPTLKITATCNGVASADGDDCDIRVREKGASTELLAASATFDFAATDGPTGTGADIERTIELLVTDMRDENDWNEETVVLTLELNANFAGADGNTYTATPQKRTLTIADDDPAPKLAFAPSSIQLAEGNMQTMTVSVNISGTSSARTGIRGKLTSLDGEGTDRGGSSDELLLSISPPEAVGSLIKIYRDATMIDEAPATDLETDREGRYIVGTIGIDTSATGGAATGAVAAAAGTDDGIDLTIKAIDVSGFRDEEITFTLMEGRTEAQKRGDGGAIEDADPATVRLLSGEETPTVTFSKASVSIDEGGSETVHLLADTDQGSQVGSATVSVSGGARISLEQNGSAISGGSVEFGGSANAELTIRALGDESLEDGEEKTATVTITDASGANIGDPRSITVTVVGSTAVPVLPLVGQLILALLLTAGGARLYRRRRQ